MPKNEETQLKCSFCGKTQDEVNRLIAGPGVYICDECIEVCNEILGSEIEAGAAAEEFEDYNDAIEALEKDEVEETNK